MSFSCFDAARLFGLGLSRKARKQAEVKSGLLNRKKDESFLNFLLDCHPKKVIEVEEAFRVRLLVVLVRGKNYVSLLHDGRHLLAENKTTLMRLVIDKYGRLILPSPKSDAEMPTLHKTFFRHCPDCASNEFKGTLMEALPPQRIEGPLPENPQDTESLKSFFENHGHFWRDWQIGISYQTCIGGDFSFPAPRLKRISHAEPFSVPWVTKLPTQGFGVEGQVVRILAHPDSNFRIVFHRRCLLSNRISVEASPLFPRSLTSIAQRKNDLPNVSKSLFQSESNLKRNRNSAVCVKAQGLNLAEKLGLLSHEEFVLISQKIALSVTTLALCFDNEGHVRYLAISANCETERTFGMQIFCESEVVEREQKREQQWGRIFTELSIEAKRQHFFKKKLLQPLLNILSSWVAGSETACTLHQQCMEQILKIINTQVLVVCGDGDAELHALKVPLSEFINMRFGIAGDPGSKGNGKKQRRRCFQLKMTSSNDLAALTSPELVVVNASRLLEGLSSWELLTDNSICRGSRDPPIPPFPAGAPAPLLLPHSIVRLENVVPPVLLDCGLRCAFAARATCRLWERLSSLIMSHFGFDFSFLTDFCSPPLLAFRCCMSLCAKRDLIFQQFPEKLKPAYEEIIRSHCRGGFAYSFRGKIKAGEYLWPDLANDSFGGSPRVSSVMELDINSSYGFAASRGRIPGGFCTGLIEGPSGILFRGDRNHRYKSFEFQSVFFTLYELENQVKMQTTAVFSNFHSQGIFFVGPYPLDLAVAKKGGFLFLYNFDGHFCHGCDAGCAPLLRYAGDEDPGDLIRRTQERNRYIRGWLDSVNNRIGKEVIQYFVVTDCHDPKYSTNELKAAFDNFPPLIKIMEPYKQLLLVEEKLLQASISSNLAAHGKHGGNNFVDALRELPESVTYLAFVDNCGDKEIGKSGENRFPPDHGACLFLTTTDPRTGAKKFQRARSTDEFRTNEDADRCLLLTRDMVDYLLSTRPNFFLCKIKSVLLFPRWQQLGETFDQIVRSRSASKCALEIRLLKNFVNYSCGFFGLNQNKGREFGRKKKPTVRLTSRLTWKTDMSRTVITPAASFAGHDYFVLKTFARLNSDNIGRNVKRGRKRKAFELTEGRKLEFESGLNDCKRHETSGSSCPTPLAAFACIVEFGKLRMQQVFDWLESCSNPRDFRHLYSNVDNFIIALAPRSIIDLPRSGLPAAVLAFEKGWKEFFGNRSFSSFENDNIAIPGGLKLVWCLGPEHGWTFTSCAPQNWSLVTESGAGAFGLDGRFKSNLLHDVTAVEFHQIACSLLDGEDVSIQQKKTKDKTVGTEVVHYIANFQPLPMTNQLSNLTSIFDEIQCVDALDQKEWENKDQFAQHVDINNEELQCQNAFDSEQSRIEETAEMDFQLPFALSIPSLPPRTDMLSPPTEEEETKALAALQLLFGNF